MKDKATVYMVSEGNSVDEDLYPITYRGINPEEERPHDNAINPDTTIALYKYRHQERKKKIGQLMVFSNEGVLKSTSVPEQKNPFENISTIRFGTIRSTVENPFPCSQRTQIKPTT